MLSASKEEERTLKINLLFFSNDLTATTVKPQSSFTVKSISMHTKILLSNCQIIKYSLFCFCNLQNRGNST